MDLEISLRVSESKQRDVGRSIARISKHSMKQLNISSGDAITLVGKKKTSAIAWPSYKKDEGKGVIRIDGFTRKNAGVAIDGAVKVSRAKVQDARAIMLAPVDMRLNVDEDFINFVKNRLMERTVTQGDATVVMMVGHAIPFEVARVRPQADCLLVTADTNLMISNEPMDIDTGEKLIQQTTSDIKMLLRHDWLKVISSRIGAENITFTIIGTDNEERNESKALDEGKIIADTRWQPVDIVVNFYSGKGDIIGTMPWLTLDTFGTVKAVYPDIQLPPDPGYLGFAMTDTGISTSTMRRCFKTGLKKCPKTINFSPKTVFVAIPFRPKFQDIYKYAIRPALEEIGFKIWKADEKISNIDIMCKICEGIQECSYIIANISDWNPNVLFEMGLAYGMGKNVILIKDRKESVPVDLKGLEYIDYETIDELKRNLMLFLKSVREDLEGKN